MSRVTGLSELLENLQALDRDMKTEARAMANAGAQIVKRQAVANIRADGRVDTGDMVKNVAVKRERGTSANWFEYHIGVRHGPEAKSAQRIAVKSTDGKIHFQWTNNPFYWWFWELGHYNPIMRQSVPAKGYIRRAIAGTQSEVLEAMRARGARRLERFTQELKK